MEPEGVPIPSTSSPSPPLTSPAGSPELPQPPAVLTDDLRDKIIKQVEYYFSDENLPSDKYLMKYASKDRGYVPIGVIASCRKIKKLTKDVSWIVAALRESSLLVVSANGKKVKRIHPLPSENKDPMLSTVVVENLPDNHSEENLQQIFGEAGNIQKIIIRDPHAARDSKKLTTTEKLLSAKLHALVEYDTVEAAEKAVAILNNEHDWRYGLRVKLLKKKPKAEAKVDARRKVWQEVDEEKNNTDKATNSVLDENHRPSDHCDDSHDEEEDHLRKEKAEEHSHKESTVEQSQKENHVNKNQNKTRGRRQKYHGANGHGHGTPPTSHHIEPSKPLPGPKMPDGTRGFAMGRGRPLLPNPSQIV